MIGFLASVGVLEANGSRGVEITRAMGGGLLEQKSIHSPVMVVWFGRIEWNRRMAPPESTLFLSLSHCLEVCPVKETCKHVFELKNLMKRVDHSIYNGSFQFAILNKEYLKPETEYRQH